MKMEHAACSETSAYKIQTPGNYPEENIQHSEHGESLKSRIMFAFPNFANPPQNGHSEKYFRDFRRQRTFIVTL
jgi:hypothetical protein